MSAFLASKDGVHCPGSGKTHEVHGQRMVKQGISYVFKGGSVHCTDCDTYVRLRDPHSATVAETPLHTPGEVRPR